MAGQPRVPLLACYAPAYYDQTLYGYTLPGQFRVPGAAAVARGTARAAPQRAKVRVRPTRARRRVRAACRKPSWERHSSPRLPLGAVALLAREGCSTSLLPRVVNSEAFLISDELLRWQAGSAPGRSGARGRGAGGCKCQARDRAAALAAAGLRDRTGVTPTNPCPRPRRHSDTIMSTSSGASCKACFLLAA